MERSVKVVKVPDLGLYQFSTDIGFKKNRKDLDYPALGAFIQYMEDTYVGERALFPPTLWGVYGRDSDNRSNNSVEGNNLLIYLLYNNNF